MERANEGELGVRGAREVGDAEGDGGEDEGEFVGCGGELAAERLFDSKGS